MKNMFVEKMEVEGIREDHTPDIPSGVDGTTVRKDDTQYKKLDTLDFSGIHWGYLNGWQSNVRGKKMKDKSLPPDSAKLAPSPSVIGPSTENEQKVAFFGLQNATVEVLPDGSLYAKKLKQADFAKIFRRHLFRLSFTKINSAYIFQAPSNSSMLRWVTKIQEAITMSEYEQAGGGSVDEKLKLAKFALEQRRWKPEEQPKLPPTAVDFDDEEDLKIPPKDSMTSTTDPRLKNLKENLRSKVDLLNQLNKQERLFLGGEIEEAIIGQERSGTVLKDYYLVPGRKETLICKGAKMTLFGQLPDKRWRCWVEIDDLITSMNQLIAEADDHGNNNADAKDSVPDSNKQHINSLSKDEILNRGYPLIGSVPSSLVKELENSDSTTIGNQFDGGIGETFIDMTPPSSPTIGIESDASKEKEPAAPYSSHGRRLSRKTVSQLSFDTFFYNGETSSAFSTSQKSEEKRRGSISNLHSPIFYQEEGNKGTEKFPLPPQVTFTGVSPRSSLGQSMSSAPKVEESPIASPNDSPVMPVKLREGGFIIKKRLRQKGISIIVGSSSSEGESESDEDENTSKNDDTEENGGTAKSKKRFSTSDIVSATNAVSEKTFEKKQASQRSSATLPPKSAHSRSLLEQFGRSGSAGGKSEGAKLFPKTSGPDVKPPRNERRTLKLSKKADKGYGFYLQTFVFPKKTDEKDAKTFVRYVEEEGPAYMAGLREGDTIVEIDGEDADQKSHSQLVDAIKNSKQELKMVVKFTDAVKRAELAIKLKKKRDRLAARMKEFEELVNKEKDLLSSATKDPSLIERADSATSSGIGLSDDSSENLSSLNEHVIIQTSKFEEQTSNVEDSISEMRYDGRANSNSARTHITTTSDLLSAYSTDGVMPLTKSKSKPVNRSRSFSGSEKKVDPESVRFRGRLNSKDDGFIRVAPSQTKSRPAAKIVANRVPPSEYSNREGSLRRPYKFVPVAEEKTSFTPAKVKSGLPVKSSVSDEQKPVDATDGKLLNPRKPENPYPRYGAMARNSRSKSYKIAVTSLNGGGRKIDEKVINFEQKRAPETDL